MTMERDNDRETEPQWTIEPARPGDSAGIVAVQKEAWLATYPDEKVGLTRQDIESVKLDTPEKLQSYERSIEEQGEGKQMWVAREDDEIIGYCIAEKTDKVHEVRAIYVHPDHQGKKVGKALMNTALEWLGPERDVCVWVFSHNKNAIEFYRSRGFVETTGEPSFLMVNGKPIPDLEMVKKRSNLPFEHI